MVFSAFGQDHGGHVETFLVPTVTDTANMTFPSQWAGEDIAADGDRCGIFRQGTYEVRVFEGNCHLMQGSDTFRADRMVTWTGELYRDEDGDPARTVLVYLEGGVEGRFVTSKTISRFTDRMWSGRLVTNGTVSYAASESEREAPELRESPLFRRAQAETFREARALLTQWTGNPSSTGAVGVVVPEGRLYSETGGDYPQAPNRPVTILSGDVSALDPNIPASDKPSIGVYQRTDVPLQVTVLQPKTPGEKSVVLFDGGVNFVIQGADALLKNARLPAGLDPEQLQVGAIDIVADRIVVWSDLDVTLLMNASRTFDPSAAQLELYLEGNVVFQQGDRKVFAERMYYDVRSRRGIVREAEVFASVPNVDGVFRLRAEEVRIPEDGVFVANDAYVTTSRMGDPLYRLQVRQLMLRSQKRPKVDPRTGQLMYDPRTGRPMTEGPNEVVGRDVSVRLGRVPLFFFPRFSASLDQPAQVVNRLSLRNDSIFGLQPIIGFDAYRLFGIRHPLPDTDWDLNFFYYSKRGPGFGSEFGYDRTGDGEILPWGLLAGPGRGTLQFWGLHDDGKDNLGYGRRSITPETRWRGQLIGQHLSAFGNDWELRCRLGLISDRNFQEEYFQDSWYTKPDRATQLEFRKTDQNRSLNLWADVRVNDFHTQTQRLPQLEFFWLGQPLLNDTLTWTSYSQVGYVHLFPDTAPEAPADRALWNLLPWEADRKGVRASTRNEIAYPFQAGSVKVVPYALGEAAFWGEDLSGDSDSRLYGQAGIRASIPFWRHYNTQSRLFNLNGIRHKVEFDVEASVSGANKSAYELPLYDLIDDRALLDFSHHMQATIFGGNPIPLKYDMRSYAIRSNLGGWVTSPSTELADDLALIRLGMHHRWQTKRGAPGQERIVDFLTLDTNINLYPDAERDNFGSVAGMLDYDLRWYPGDRITLYSSGYFDFFSDGLRMVDVGGILDRPGKGSIFASLHYLTGPVENVVLKMGYNYRMSEKWTSTFVSAFDISGRGNIGEAVSITRVGESFLGTLGCTYDNPSGNFGVHLTIEPRFGKRGNTAKLFHIAPPGMYGVE